MNGNQQFRRDDGDGILRRYEYDDQTVLMADFGSVDGSVDVVDGTAIVVTGDDDQYEIEIPEGTTRATMNHGVVTIEVST